MKSKFVEPQYIKGFVLITILFFMWGLSYGLLDVLNKHFQEVLHITKAESGFLQAAYFGGYFIIALPAGYFISKKGYKAGIIFGLSLYALGSLLFIPASGAQSYIYFLAALFIASLGLGFLETSANPYSSALGQSNTAAQRLNLSQSFNGLGQFSGPIIGGLFFFNHDSGQVNYFAGMSSVTLTYVIIAIVLLILIVVFLFTRLPDLRSLEKSIDEHNKETKHVSIWTHKEFKFGVLALFLYLSSQSGVSSFFINLCVETWPESSSKSAAFGLAIGLLGFMIGRFITTSLMAKFSPVKILFVYGVTNIFLCAIILLGLPYITVIAAILIYFFMSIMFPTIFSLSVKNLGSKSKIGSSFMIMAMIGGAVSPYFMGKIADIYATHNAFIIPLFGFAYIALYGKIYSKLTGEPDQFDEETLRKIKQTAH